MDIEKVEWLKVKKVAELLDCNYLTVINLINSGILPAYRVGGNFRVRKEDFKEFLDKAKVKKI